MLKLKQILAIVLLLAAFLTGLTAALGVEPVQASPPLRPLAIDRTVTSTADAGAGSLRQALLDSGPDDSISFNTTTFPPGSPATISLSSALPDIITDNLTIDGSSAGVILDGGGLGSGNGLTINGASGVTIKGLQILNFPDYGIQIHNGATNNTIGGSNPGPGCAGDCNLISGNGNHGIRVDSDNNTIDGNFIGVNAAGTGSFPNDGSGIALGGAFNIVGTGNPTPGAGCDDGCNLISGNNDRGINLGGHDNTIAGNYIGTNVTGTAAIPNQDSGINIDGGNSNNDIGGNLTDERNLISGNVGAGVEIGDSGTSNNKVQGNYIGTTANGSSALPNGGDGVSVYSGAQYNRIGGSAAGDGNLISGNSGNGVFIQGAGPQNDTPLLDDVSLTRNGGPDQLINGDFSQGLGHWATNDDNPSATRSLNTTDFHSAPASYQFNRNGGLRGMNTYYDTISQTIVITEPWNLGSSTWVPVSTGEVVALTFWYKGSVAFVRLNGRNTGGYDVTLTQQSLPAVTDWTQAALTTTVPADIDAVHMRFLVKSELPTTYNIIQGNKIGTDPSGAADVGNGDSGVTISDAASDNTIGGSNAGEGNLISGNDGQGLELIGLGTVSNTVSGNYIGTDVTGMADLGNSNVGIRIFDGASKNIIGGSIPGERNLISGNDSHGIQLWDSNTISNTISGNFIGTDANGTGVIGNTRYGIKLGSGVRYNIVGGTSAGERNLISGNDSGIVFEPDSGTTTSHNVIIGNYIGTDVSGSFALGNGPSGVGIGMWGDPAGFILYNRIGGSTLGERNLISGNNSDGININNINVMSNTVSGNYIGTDVNGNSPIANADQGIFIGDGAQYNLIGGSNPTPDSGCSGACNLLSGNASSGILIQDADTDHNTISGNYIGTNITGTTALPNDEAGVFIFLGPRNNTIGGDMAGERNLISGNNDFGVRIEHPATLSNTVKGNYIGVMAGGTGDLGNTGAGVGFNFNTTANEVSDNIIAYTKHDPEGEGCGVYAVTVGGNPLRRNSIYNNDGKGICSGGSPNRPVLTEVYTDTYEVHGTAIANSTIEIFSDDDDEGRYYEGTTTANAFGKFSFDGITPFQGNKVTATAIKASGSTSEFALSLSGTGRFEGTGQALGDENSNDCDLGDIDVDGDLDAICANSSPNAIYLNNGRGIFEADSTQTLGNNSSQAIALGDVDNDGLLDVVIGNASGATNQVWLNGGSGVFDQDQGQSLMDDDTQAIALEDLDGLNGLDLVVGNSDGQTEIWLNNGSGVFQPPVTLPSLFTDTHGLAVGLLNDDDHPDIFVANGTGQPNQVWLNNGNGTFSGSGEELGAFDSQAVALGDLNDDGHLDAFVANGSGQFDVVWLNEGNGQFISRTVGISNSNGVAIGRFNNDKYPDVIVASDSDQPNYVLLNNGDATFDINPIPCNSSADSQDIAIGDLDNDGDLDVFVANGDDDDEDDPEADDRPNQVLKNLNNLRNRVGPSGGTLDFGQGMPLTLQVPANALNEFANFDYVPNGVPDSAPANMLFAGRAFSISTSIDSIGGSTVFSRPVTTTVYFDPETFEGSRPLLHYWETEGDKANTWVDVAETCTELLGSPSSYSYGDNWLKVGLCHLTEFGIFGALGSDVYLPIILKNK